jgi:hypothetical protein
LRKASIDSIFEENGEWFQREFSFNADGIEPDDNIKKGRAQKNRARL